MFQISISEFSTYQWSLFQDVLQAAKREFDGIGIWRKKADEVGDNEAVDFLQEMNLPVSSLSWAGGFTGSDGRSHVAAVDDALDAIELAHKLQAGCLIVHPGSLNNHTRRHATRLLTGALKAIVPFASDLGVRLAMEPRFGRGALEWTFLNQFDQTMDLIGEYSCQEVGLVLDLFHVGHCNSIFERLGEIRERIALVQVADRGKQLWAEDNRCLPGKGGLPINRWLKRLTEIGYDGFLELEVHGYDVETIPYDQLLNDLHSAMHQLTVPVRTGALKRSQRSLS